MSSWFQDLRLDVFFGWRILRKNPVTTVVAAVSLALGIGVNTGIFSMLNGLFRPLPVKDPERIVVLAADMKGDDTGLRYRFSYQALLDFRREATPFSDVFGWNANVRGLSFGGKTVAFFYSPVTGNYFSALGLQPAVGRFFLPGEGEHASDPWTVVLGYGFWIKRFGGDPSVVGRQVRINGRAATVIGVAPKEFHGVYTVADLDGYMPLASFVLDDARSSRGVFSDRAARNLTVFARLKPGVSVRQAQKFMTALARRMAEQYPDTDAGVGIRVVPELLARPVPLRFMVDVMPLIRFVLLLLAGVVLLLACMNVANILLVRATVRQREMAIRAALGSGRGRLIRQMLAESTLLTLAGAAAGTVLGQWSTQSYMRTLDLATDLPFVLDFSFDWSVFGYSLAAAVFTGLFIGIWPALRASQADAGTALHDGGRSNSGGRERQRGRALLVVGQVAGSLMLLMCAGVFVRSLRSAQHIDLGFAPDHLLNVRMDPSWAGYDQQRGQDFYRELKRRVQTWPEARSATLAFSVPMGMYGAGMPVEIVGRPLPQGQQIPAVGCNFVDPDYFATLEIPIVRGRAFRESDDERAPRVAIINETMARRFWPNQDPIGKRFRTGSQETLDQAPLAEVVGVAHDAKYLAVFEGSLPYFYLPDAQYSFLMKALQIRTTVAPERLHGRLEREIERVDGNVIPTEMESEMRVLNGPQGFEIFQIGAIQAASMGILGLVLALVGVYGVVSYGAAQRTREIGIRMALGATPRAVLRIILGQGVWLIIAGIAIGLTGALTLRPVMARFLLNVSAADPVTLMAIPAALAVVALWACFLPARRAMRVDPMAALRHE